MSGAIPPLPNTTLWRGAQLKNRDFTFALPLLLLYYYYYYYYYYGDCVKKILRWAR
jgi:hypothetical protein